MLKNRIYYTIKPLVPRRLQIFLRRQIAFYKSKKYKHVWPIDPAAGKPPEGWTGWPGGKKFAFVLSHDVDTQKGHDQCLKLVELEESLGFRSAFNFVPERYNVSESLRKELISRGFEVGVHGLNHDGKLFFSRRIFNERAKRINYYLKEWNTGGFTSPSMHHNLEWMHALKISHSTSTFDTDPFEPQSDPVETIFPFWVPNSSLSNGYVEHPYTLPQDHALFVIMKERDIKIWKEKLDWIAEKGGMALLNSHPDYMNFNESKAGLEEYPSEHYREFLEYIKRTYKDQYWQALPAEVTSFWKSNMIDELAKSQ